MPHIWKGICCLNKIRIRTLHWGISKVSGPFMKNLRNMEMWRIKSCAMNVLKSLNLVFATAFTNFWRLVKWKIVTAIHLQQRSADHAARHSPMHLALPHHHLCQLGSPRQPWSQPIFAQFQLSTHVKVSRPCHQILKPCALKNTTGIRFCLQKV